MKPKSTDINSNHRAIEHLSLYSATDVFVICILYQVSLRKATAKRKRKTHRKLGLRTRTVKYLSGHFVLVNISKSAADVFIAAAVHWESLCVAFEFV